jgi:hypothetical protein
MMESGLASDVPIFFVARQHTCECRWIAASAPEAHPLRCQNALKTLATFPITAAISVRCPLVAPAI